MCYHCSMLGTFFLKFSYIWQEFPFILLSIVVYSVPGDPGSDQSHLGPFPHRAYRLVGEMDITQVIGQILYDYKLWQVLWKQSIKWGIWPSFGWGQRLTRKGPWGEDLWAALWRMNRLGKGKGSVQVATCVEESPEWRGAWLFWRTTRPVGLEQKGVKWWRWWWWQLQQQY